MSTFPIASASKWCLKTGSMRKIALTLLFTVISVSASLAQSPGNIQKASLSSIDVDRIVKKFTANEGLFRSALADYNFSRKAIIQTIGMGGQVTGEYRRDSE